MKMENSVLEKVVRGDRCDTQLSECGSPAKLWTSALERSERSGRRSANLISPMHWLSLDCRRWECLISLLRSPYASMMAPIPSDVSDKACVTSETARSVA